MAKSSQYLHIVIGMPGSGKTTYLKHLLKNRVVDIFFDDYQKGAPEENKSNPRLSPNYLALCSAIRAGKNVAIADIRYCLSEEQTLIDETMHKDFPETRLIYTYFENNPEACRHNVSLRNREDYLELELEHIETMSAKYKPPQNQTIPVIMGH